MGAQVLEGPLAGDVGLDEEAQHGEHGQPSVLDLLHLEQRRLVGVGGEAERVERAAWVELVIEFQSVGDPVVLGASDEDDLGDDGEDQVDRDAVAEVVEGVAVKEQGAGLEPNGLGAAVRAKLVERLGDDESGGAEHGPPGMDELKGLVLGEVLWLLAQTKRIVAVVSGNLAVEVLRHLRPVKEAVGQVDPPVRAVPLGEFVVDAGARGGHGRGLRLRGRLLVEAVEEGDDLLRAGSRRRCGIPGGAGEVEPGAEHLGRSERRHCLKPKVGREKGRAAEGRAQLRRREREREERNPRGLDWRSSCGSR